MEMWAARVMKLMLVAWVLMFARVAIAEEVDPPMDFRFEVVVGVRVLWLEGGIGANSAANVTKALSQTSRYDEVWLNSPGGDVDEGFEIGRKLRQLRATVRVPARKEVICASSCTNLMLGGYNRTVEDGAAFYVHAASSVMQIDKDKNAFLVIRPDPVDWRRSSIRNVTYGQLIAEALKDPRLLVDTLELRQKLKVQSSVEMVNYFQEVIDGTPNVALYRQLKDHKLPLLYGEREPWVGVRSLAIDLATLRNDGVLGLQEILTKIELHTMKNMKEVIRSREAELGRGAKVANRIFEATLACRIQDLCLLTRHQLANLGYHNFDRN